MTKLRTYPYVVTPEDLGAEERQRMYSVLCEHFDNVDRDTFESDLSEKDWVIRIDDAEGCIQGFSTLQHMVARWRGERVHAIFSGDTVLSRAYMSESSWMGTWTQLAFSKAAELAPEKCYWLLLTATHRTFRILPSCFHRHYPDPGRPDDAEARALTGLFVRQKFPQEFCEETGTVVLENAIPYRHASEVEAASGEHREANRWFRKANPGYLRGDFLCCLTELEPDNLTALGQRILNMPIAQETT
jgi:hypothetical protein